MPNRILRDCTDSDKVNSISVQAERFLYRLFMKADDFGCFYADSRLLKAHLFPLQLDTIKESDVTKWVQECEGVGLICIYELKGKRYIEIVSFNQQLRQKRRKFPDKSECKQVDSRLIAECTPETKRIQNPETETKLETEIESEACGALSFVIRFNYLTQRNFKVTDKVKKQYEARIKENYTEEMILKAAENCLSDPFHVQNPNHLTPEFITRPDKLEKYTNYIKTATNGQPTRKPAKGEYSASEYRDAIHEVFRRPDS